MFHILKQFDIFSQPVELFMTSHDKTSKEKKFSDSHGSVFGGVLTIICYATSFAYLQIEYHKMMSGENDKVNIQSMHNPMTDVSNQVFAANSSSFFPWIEIN